MEMLGRSSERTMKIVQPNDVTTLLLDPTYMPFATATARAAFYIILRSSGSGIDADGNPYKWDQYIEKNISILPDQPIMRSGFNSVYNDNVWIIPTVITVNSKFFFRRKKAPSNSLPPLKEVYDFYKGMCCFCHTKIRITDASREHIHSKSLGGSNHEDNIALSCRECNCRAGNVMPKLDINGEEVVAKMRVRPSHYILPDTIQPREEWNPYLFV